MYKYVKLKEKYRKICRENLQEMCIIAQSSNIEGAISRIQIYRIRISIENIHFETKYSVDCYYYFIKSIRIF